MPNYIHIMWPGDLAYDPRWHKLKQTLLPISKRIEQKLWSLVCPQGISVIWPKDLVYYPSRPKFKLNWDFITKNILTNFQANWARIVASRVPTRYFYHLT